MSDYRKVSFYLSLFLLFLLFLLFQIGCDKKNESEEGDPRSIACESDSSLKFVSDIIDISDRSNINGITGLGTLTPPSHTFPTPHTNIGILDQTKKMLIKNPQTATLLNVSSRANAGGVTMSLDFKVCDNRSYGFGHLNEISEEIMVATGCTSSTECNWEGKVIIESETAIGYKGGSNTDGANLDFRAVDSNLTAASLPGGFNVFGNNIYAACPFEYFEDAEVKSFYMDGLVNVDSNNKCGTVEIDVVNTLQGYWFDADYPSSDETYHLTIAPALANADRHTIAAGSEKIGAAGFLYEQQSSGQLNRSAADISSDGKKYCFEDLFSHPITNDSVAGYLLMEMISAVELKIERFSIGSCKSDIDSMEFTSNMASFVRI